MICITASVCELMRRAILDRDEERCQLCGEDLFLHVHHLSHNVPCKFEDFITLCGECHWILHGLPFTPDLKIRNMPKEVLERLSKYIEQRNVRLPPELAQEFMAVCEFEHVKPTELIRMLIRERIREVTSSRAYQDWRRRREAEKEGGGEE